MLVDMGEQRLPNPYRHLRATPAGTDSPWRGTIAQAPDGARVLLVDAGDLPGLWPGWRASADDHVVAPIDIVRTLTSHVVVLPLCGTRLEDVLDRRAASATPLGLGETVTVCVSVLRGLAGVRRHGVDGPGQWWLDDAGRPLLALGVGSEDAATACARLLARLSSDLDPSTANGVRELCEEPRASAFRHDVVEEALFALAPAEPLAHANFPARAGASSFDALITPRPAVSIPWGQDGADDPSSGPTTPWVARLARHVDAGVADHVSRVTTAVWRALRTNRTARPASRRAAWGLAAASALIVVAVGMLLPPDATGSAHETPGGEGEESTPVVASPAPSTSEDGAIMPEVTADPALIAGALLSARIDCAGDGDCLASLLTDPATSLRPGVIDLPDSARTVHLVDEFGGVAVVRVDAEGEPSQLVVIERRDDRWLLRDAYDIAQQP